MKMMFSKFVVLRVSPVEYFLVSVTLAKLRVVRVYPEYSGLVQPSV
jgi:hypothetical protein